MIRTEVKCDRCGLTQVVKGHGLRPESVWRSTYSAGWGKNSNVSIYVDVCSDCHEYAVNRLEAFIQGLKDEFSQPGATEGSDQSAPYLGPAKTGQH